MAGVNITFNSTSLQTLAGSTGIVAYPIEHDHTPDRQLYQYNTARMDGSKLTGTYYAKKIIKVEGKIIGSSIADADSRIDSFKQAMAAQESNLDIDYNGGTRRYVATVQNLVITRPPHHGFATFSAEFNCSQAFGIDTSSSTLLSAVADTTTPVSKAITPGGSALTQAPAITALLNSGTGLTNQSITIDNPATGVGITVTRTWAASDSLVVDCAAFTVKVNGTAVDYSGAFPSWPPGSGNIRRADTFTTRNITLSATYTKRWL